MESAYVASGVLGAAIIVPILVMMLRHSEILPSWQAVRGILARGGTITAPLPPGITAPGRSYMPNGWADRFKDMLAAWKARRQAKAKEAEQQYETVFVYDQEGHLEDAVDQRGRKITDENGEIVQTVVRDRAQIWRASLPASELLANLDWRSRWHPDTIVHYILAIGAGVIGAAFLSWWFVSGPMGIPPAAWFLKGVFTVFGSVALGGPLGWKLAPRFGPRPLWIMRRTRLRVPYEALTPQQQAESAATGLDYYTSVHESYIHTRYREAEWATIEYEDPKTKEKVTMQRPHVHRASDWYEITEARDETEMHKTTTQASEKIDIVLLVVASLVGMGLLFLFATANSGA